MDERVGLLFLQGGIGDDFSEQGEGDISIVLDGVVERVEEVLGKVGGCEYLNLILLIGLLELFQQGRQTAPSNIAI